MIDKILCWVGGCDNEIEWDRDCCYKHRDTYQAGEDLKENDIVYVGSEGKLYKSIKDDNNGGKDEHAEVRRALDIWLKPTLSINSKTGETKTNNPCATCSNYPLNNRR